MKTQGITLMTSRTTEVKVKRKTEATDTTFDSFISNNATAASRNRTSNESIADTRSKMENSSKVQTSKKSEDGSSSNKTAGKDADNTQVNNDGKETGTVKADSKTDAKNSVNDTAETKETGTETALVNDDGTVNIEKVNEEVMAILQDMFSMFPEELNDIFDMMDMQPADLISGIMNGDIESFSITTVQTFVMEVHGIEDPGAFLTNDLLNSELNDLYDKMKSILAEMMRVGVEDLDKVEKSVWDSIQAQLSGIRPESLNENGIVQNENVIPVDNDAEAVSNVTADDVNDINIVVENNMTDQGMGSSSQSGAETGTGTGAGQGAEAGLGSEALRDAATDLETATRNQAVSNAQAFAEAVTEAMDPDVSEIAGATRQMTEIVEQVVRQVSIRMMPESTNMELQLHPASLGRVNVQINATGQDATAKIIVENQQAKEALESGMIRLQEAFEERGLKVTEVEVEIGNFDLGLRQQNDQSSEGDGRSDGRGNRAGSGSETDAVTEAADAAERNLTDASRVEANSTVDYTA
ncbi:MAG: flagellar hook-length control protein FliK [Eubacterium sp.]|nr:flagellar hook-length control protein FliK [Eubacterium sp.]